MTAILPVCLLVALVWTAVVFLRGGLLGGCLVVLLAGTCFGAPFFSLPGPVPLTADRLLWVVLLVQYVIWRRLGLADRKPLGAAEIVLCAFLGVLAVSTFSHDWQANDWLPLARLLFYYAMPFGLYWVAREIRFTERGALVLFASLGVFGVYLAVTALAETTQQWWAVFPRYIGSTADRDFLGRARGPLLNPAGSGLLTGVCLAAALMGWPRLNRRGRLLLIVASLVMAVGVYCTYTRSPWLGAGLGVFILLALTLPRSWRGLVLGSLVLSVALVGAAKWERILAFKRDEDAGVRAAAQSVEMRPILAMVAWNMFLDRPLTGCGFGQYADRHVDYLADRSSGLLLEKARTYSQHNLFLSLLAETGLVGFALFLLLLILWTRDAWRVWRSRSAPLGARQIALLFFVLLANYAVIAMFHEVSLIPMVNMFFFFLAGITAGLRAYGSRAAAPTSASSEIAPSVARPLGLDGQPIA